MGREHTEHVQALCGRLASLCSTILPMRFFRTAARGDGDPREGRKRLQLPAERWSPTDVEAAPLDLNFAFEPSVAVRHQPIIASASRAARDFPNANQPVSSSRRLQLRTATHCEQSSSSRPLLHTRLPDGDHSVFGAYHGLFAQNS